MKDEQGRIIITDQSSIPHFNSEAEERAYFDKHILSTDLFETADPTEFTNLKRSRKRLTKESNCVTRNSSASKSLNHSPSVNPTNHSSDTI